MSAAVRMKRLNRFFNSNSFRTQWENHTLINAVQLSNAKIEIELKTALRMHRTVCKDRRTRERKKKKNRRTEMLIIERNLLRQGE